MPRKVNRHDTVAVLRGIERNLLAVQAALNTLIEDLHVGIHLDHEREIRQYDLPPEDSDAVAARHGIDTDPPDDGEIPEWVIARYGHLWTQESS